MLRTAFRLMVAGFLSMVVTIVCAVHIAHAGSVTYDDPNNLLKAGHAQIQTAAATAPFDVMILVRGDLTTDAENDAFLDKHSPDDHKTIYILYNDTTHDYYWAISHPDVTRANLKNAFDEASQTAGRAQKPWEASLYISTVITSLTQTANVNHARASAAQNGQADAALKIFGLTLSPRWFFSILIFGAVVLGGAYKRSRARKEQSDYYAWFPPTYDDPTPPDTNSSVDSPLITDVTTAGFVGKATRDGVPHGYHATVRAPEDAPATKAATDDDDWAWFDDLIKK